jgi:hypothetical protein
MVFVTGASRSGTTMLSRVLGNHSQVLGLNELHYFGDLWDLRMEPVAAPVLERLAASVFARQARGIWGEGPTDLDQRRAARMVAGLESSEQTGAGVFAAVLGELVTDAGKRIACEQTPRNIFYARRLLEIYPGARVVHLVRDPRAVLASQKNRWRRKYLGGANIPISEVIRVWVNYHPVTMSRLWVKANQAALDLVGHPRFLLLRFEDLVANPEQEVRRLCGFLGIAFDPVMLEVPQIGSSNRPNQEARKGIAKDVLDRWERVLGKGEIALCERIARPLMERFSYAARSRGSALDPALIPPLLSYPLHAAGVIMANPRRVWIQLNALVRHHN